MSAVSPNANIPDGSKGAATCLLCSLLILCEIKRIWRESFIRKKRCTRSVFFVSHRKHRNHRITHALCWCWLASRDILVARRMHEIYKMVASFTRNLAAFAECSLFLIFDRRWFVPAPTRNLDRWQRYLR